jgi:branched-chain amino acid transport system permease protein
MTATVDQIAIPVAEDRGRAATGRLTIWGLYAAILVVAPLVFSQGSALSILSQMGTVMIFALSYNMLLGQGGMLSFGHAAYSGLGAYFAIHALNLAGKGVLPIPTTLIPLVGGLAGVAFGVLFGYVTTKKSGTTFAMITLGIVELVFACVLMFPGFFGGEGGIATNRAAGQPFLGITYGPQIEVYYLIAFWLFIATIGMYAFTQTPLGRLANAVRDNPERAEFIGYDTQRVRYLTLILSAFFAGISGGLSVINFEIVTAENVSILRSGGILLFTFIGGIGFFFGPMIGAVVGVFLTVLLSEYTKAWQLYLGLFFVLIVMYAPGGIASLLMAQWRVIQAGMFHRVRSALLKVCGAYLLAAAGAAIAIEMGYHVALESANGSAMNLFGLAIDTADPAGWLVAAALFSCGVLVVILQQEPFRATWSEVNSGIANAHRGEST